MMARDGTISGDRLREILKALPQEIRIGTFDTGNLSVYGQDKYLGYIDTVQEKFWTVRELAEQQIEKNEEPVEPVDDLSSYYEIHRIA